MPLETVTVYHVSDPDRLEAFEQNEFAPSDVHKARQKQAALAHIQPRGRFMINHLAFCPNKEAAKDAAEGRNIRTEHAKA